MGSFDEHPIQSASAVAEVYGMHRTTLSNAFHRGALGKAAYQSGGILLIDTSHPDFLKYHEMYKHQPRAGGKMMKSFTVHGDLPYSGDYAIHGHTLEAALATSFSSIARNAGMRSYHLVEVACEYRQGILGGKGGAELVIKWNPLQGLNLRPSKAINTSVVWIYATPEDIPEPFTIPLASSRN